MNEKSELVERAEQAGVTIERVTISLRCNNCGNTWSRKRHFVEQLLELRGKDFLCIECFYRSEDNNEQADSRRDS